MIKFSSKFELRTPNGRGTTLSQYNMSDERLVRRIETLDVSAPRDCTALKSDACDETFNVDASLETTRAHLSALHGMRRPFELQAPDLQQQQQQQSLEHLTDVRSDTLRSIFHGARGFFGQTFATVAVDSAFDVPRRAPQAGARVMQPPTSTSTLPGIFSRRNLDVIAQSSSSSTQYSASALHVALPQLEKSGPTAASTLQLQHVHGSIRLHDLSQGPQKNQHLNVQPSHNSLPSSSSFGHRHHLTDRITHEPVPLSHGKRRSCSPPSLQPSTNHTTTDYVNHFPGPTSLSGEPTPNNMQSDSHARRTNKNRSLNKPTHLPDLPESAMRVAHGFPLGPLPTLQSPVLQPLSQSLAPPHHPPSILDSPAAALASPADTHDNHTPSPHPQASIAESQGDTHSSTLLGHSPAGLASRPQQHWRVPATPSSSPCLPTPTPSIHARTQQASSPLSTKSNELQEPASQHADGVLSTEPAGTKSSLQATTTADLDDSSRRAGKWSEQPSRFFGHLRHPGHNILSPIHHPAAHKEAATSNFHDNLASLLSPVKHPHKAATSTVKTTRHPEVTPAPTSTKSGWRATVDRLSMPSSSRTLVRSTAATILQHHPDPKFHPSQAPAPELPTLAPSLSLTSEEHRHSPPHKPLTHSATPELHQTPTPPAANSLQHSLDGSLHSELSRERSYSTSPQPSPSVSYNGSFVQDEDTPHSTRTSRHSPGRRVTLMLPECGGGESTCESDEGCSGDESSAGQLSSRSTRAGSIGKHKAFVSNMSRFKQASVRDPTAYATESSKRPPSNCGHSLNGGPVPSLHVLLREVNGDNRITDEEHALTHSHTRAFRPMHAPRVHGDDYTDPTAVDYDFDTGNPLEMDDTYEDALPSERSSRNRYIARSGMDSNSGGHVPRAGFSMRGDEALLLGPGHVVTTGSILRRKAPVITMRSAVGGTSFRGGQGSVSLSESSTSPPPDAIGMQINASLAAHRAYLDTKSFEALFAAPEHPAVELYSHHGQRSSPGSVHHHQAQHPAGHNLLPVFTRPAPVQIPEQQPPAVGFHFSPTFSDKGAHPRVSLPDHTILPASHSSNTQYSLPLPSIPNQQQNLPNEMVAATSAAVAAIPMQIANNRASLAPETPLAQTKSLIQIHTPHHNRLQLLSPGGHRSSTLDIPPPATPTADTPLTAAAAAAAAAAEAAASAAAASAAAAAADLAAAAAALAVPEGRRSDGGGLRKNKSRNNSHAANGPTPEELVRRRAEQVMEKTRTRLDELEAERAKIEAVEFARRAQKHFQSSFPVIETPEDMKKHAKSYCHFTQSANYMKWVLHRADLVGRALDHNNQITIVGNNSRGDAAGADAERQFERVYALTEN